MFECNFCEEVFNRKSSVVNHQKHCVKNPDNDAQCAYCGDYVSKAANKYCSTTCSNKDRVQTDKTREKIRKSVHEFYGTESDVSRCPVCCSDVPADNNQFCSRECYIRVQDEEKAKKCKICDRRYVDNPSLNHSGHKCNSCVTKIRRHRCKLAAIKLLGGKCQECGYDKHTAALEFHHKDDNKNFNIGQLSNKSWDVVKKEVKKCVLLCSNCHREEHSTRNDRKFLEEVREYNGQRLDFDMILI